MGHIHSRSRLPGDKLRELSYYTEYAVSHCAINQECHISKIVQRCFSEYHTGNITRNHAHIVCLIFQCKYKRLKEKTGFPDHMAISDSEWMRSNNDLMMWERNLRASEVKTNNGISNRPFNEKRD